MLTVTNRDIFSHFLIFSPDNKGNWRYLSKNLVGKEFSAWGVSKASKYFLEPKVLMNSLVFFILSSEVSLVKRVSCESTFIHLFMFRVTPSSDLKKSSRTIDPILGVTSKKESIFKDLSKWRVTTHPPTIFFDKSFFDKF